MITNIYFDWSGTLAYPRTRDIFLNGRTLEEKLSSLYSDVIYTLDYLTNRGYKLGIISNTSKDKKHILKSLKDTGLIKYFKGTIALSNEKHLCKKGCRQIFEYSLKNDKILPQNSIMIGNNYKKDILGSKNIGMWAIFVDREESTVTSNIADLTIKNISDLTKYF